MILRDVMVLGKELQCEVCGFKWVSIARTLPMCCPDRACRSREWDGPKKRGRKKIELPKPQISRWVEQETDF